MGTRFDDYMAESAATDTEAGRQMSAAFSAHYDAVHEAQFELGRVVAERRAERGLTQAQVDQYDQDELAPRSLEHRYNEEHGASKPRTPHCQEHDSDQISS